VCDGVSMVFAEHLNPMRRFAAVVVLGLIVFAGCGGSSKPVSIYGRRYLAIIAPANQALDAFNAGMRALPSSPTPATYVRISTPLAAAFNAAREKLLRVSWPASTLPDVEAVTVAISVVDTDLTNVPTVNAANFRAWQNHLLTDLGRILAPTDRVRTDLGLPLGKV
jgi:hypothetical protein